jgi:hypothetical protein
MMHEQPDETSDLEKTELILAVRVYLRQDSQLRRAGQPPLVEQPHWAEAALWSRACQAAERLLGWAYSAH